MKTVFINHLEKISENVDYGLAVVDKTVKENFEIMFEKNIAAVLLIQAKNHAAIGGINFFMRFCQYVVLVQINVLPTFNGSMNFIDCHNDLDSALDQYLSYKENNWEEQSKQDFMKYFEEIRNDANGEKAQMIIKDAADDINSYL